MLAATIQESGFVMTKNGFVNNIGTSANVWHGQRQCHDRAVRSWFPFGSDKNERVNKLGSEQSCF